jgi:hypothetical protein
VRLNHRFCILRLNGIFFGRSSLTDFLLLLANYPWRMNIPKEFTFVDSNLV